MKSDPDNSGGDITLSRIQDTSGLGRDYRPPAVGGQIRAVASKTGLRVYDSVAEGERHGIGTSGGLPYIDPRESFRVIPPLHR